MAFMWQAAGNNSASGAFEMGEEGIYNALRAGDGGGSSRGQMVAYNPYRTLEKDGTITSGFGARPVVDALHGPTGNKEPLLVPSPMQVRRLLPVECERLQGFPDGWTEGRSDSTRYRLLGNAVCVPVAEWIGHRLASADKHRYPQQETP
jgi:DNA (cytosine-5)-methyltransferase 1